MFLGAVHCLLHHHQRGIWICIKKLQSFNQIYVYAYMYARFMHKKEIYTRQVLLPNLWGQVGSDLGHTACDECFFCFWRSHISEGLDFKSCIWSNDLSIFWERLFDVVFLVLKGCIERSSGYRVTNPHN
jgi:hypothetical protein